MGCGGKKSVPDVSDIKVNLQLQRFEQDFFSIDTNHISQSLPVLQKKYPIFLGDFVQNILGLSLTDPGMRSDSAIRMFLHDYQIVKDTASIVFKDSTKWMNDIRKGLQFTKHYFPKYQAPAKVITFIGPIDAVYETPLGKTGDVITQDALAIGLQLHLGPTASLYQSQTAQTIFPSYVSRRFAPEFIPVNAMKNIVDDIFPDETAGKPLLDQMIDKGKRLYLLGLLLPDCPDTLKIGYSKRQLDGCIANEGLIWNFFLANDLLYNNDNARIQNYIEESPSTQEFAGSDIPGFIGLFVGWQIVTKYMEIFPDTSPESLLGMDAKQILADSKYKPK